jgi:hypothetical protein
MNMIRSMPRVFSVSRSFMCSHEGTSVDYEARDISTSVFILTCSFTTIDAQKYRTSLFNIVIKLDDPSW